MNHRIVLIALILGVLFTGPAPQQAQSSSIRPVDAAAASCGYKPYKPYTPYGCKDLVAMCLCGTDGHDCHWEWVCVPR